MKRLLLAIACVVVFSGCDLTVYSRASTPGFKTVVVLFDLSGSTGRDRPVYEEATKHVLAILGPGDRFVMGPITSRSGDDFASSVDVSLPPPPMTSIWDMPSQKRRAEKEFEANLATRRNELDASVKRFLGQKANAEQTAIFESVRTIAPLFQDLRRQRLLIVLSDMIEDSAMANFGVMRLSPEAVERQLKDLHTKQLIPVLKGVEIYVAGATASPPERASNIERFWRRYFEDAGANMAPGAYGRTLTGSVGQR